MVPSVPVIALAVLATHTSPVADVPFDDVNGLVFFEVSVAGSAPLSALLDTGFDVSVLDTGAAARLGLSPNDVKTEAAPGGAVEAGRLSPVALSIGALSLDVALTTVAVGGLAPVVGRPVDVILGHDVLERCVVDVDWSQRRLRFLDPATFVHTGPGVVLPMAVRDAQPLVPAGVAMPDGRAVFGLFKLDTGSLDAAGLNLNFVRDNSLLAPGTRELSVGGIAVGGGTEGRLFRAAELWLGSCRLDRPLVAYTVESKGFENRADAGTLGVALLSRWRLLIDYPRGRLILEDSPSARGPAREDQSGLLLLSPPGSGALQVAQVVPTSPASDAGLAAGDEVVSLAGRRIGLVEARRLLQDSGPIALVVRRNGVERGVTLMRRPLLP